MEALEEISQFLDADARLDLKATALEYVLGLSGSDEGRTMLVNHPPVLKRIVALVRDSVEAIRRDACLAVVNISAEEQGARALLGEEIGKEVAWTLLSVALNPESDLSDPACMVLSNITRPSSLVQLAVDLLGGDGAVEKIVSALVARNHNKKGHDLHYLGPLLSNLSQSAAVRRYLMSRDRCVIQRLLPFTEFSESVVRRGGVVGALRNCCFDLESHPWLLSPEVDLLPRLLIPLAGPEEFPDEEMDKLPLELQYLSETKQRERDPDIRRMLLEALMQLCATRAGREHMRNCNTYLILREFHKWETDRAALLSCENVVDVLIRTEDEIGQENLRDIDVPEDLQEKFAKMDSDAVEESS